MKPVRAKKKLGQLFLKDHTIHEKIDKLLTFNSYGKVLDIRHGIGILT